MALNARQEAFAQHLAKGMSQEAAYEAAGYTARGDAARVNASRLLLTNADVASRVRELQEASAEEAVIDAATLSAQLEDIRKKAIESNQLGAAAQAVMGRAKLHGLIVDKAEVKDVTPITPEQRQAEIDRLLAKRGAHLRVVGG
jgi:phage terminase small subunit